MAKPVLARALCTTGLTLTAIILVKSEESPKQNHVDVVKTHSLTVSVNQMTPARGKVTQPQEFAFYAANWRDCVTLVLHSSVSHL